MLRSPQTAVHRISLIVPALILFLVVSLGSSYALGEAVEPQPIEAEEQTDSTPTSESSGTLEIKLDQIAAGSRRWYFAGDFRPILATVTGEAPNGTEIDETDLGLRARANLTSRLTPRLRIGAGLAWRCVTDNCDPDFVMQPELPTPNGLAGGQLTFDELYVHWYTQSEQRLDLLAGRFQSRSVLRGGVYAKSLDRNDSNNTRITWTDGFQAAYRTRGGWRSNFVWQRNSEQGAGSIRRGPMDFSSGRARNTYFTGVENLNAWGPVVQRSLNVSWLPDSLLKDNDPQLRREDYWGIVGRLAARWPQRSQGLRLRGGFEIGYAPETPTQQSAGFDGPGDTGGLAWNVVANLMDFASGHSIGVNYGRTQAGWLISPQFFPNTEMLEFRYQWRGRRGPMIEARIRRQEQLDQQISTGLVVRETDFYLRLTWEFGDATTRVLRSTTPSAGQLEGNR